MYPKARLALAQWNRQRAMNPPPTRSDRTSRERARKQLPPLPCALQHIGGCLGRIDCAHIDGNPFNNHPDNLMNLCHSHHRLFDLGRIDPANPTMPPFRVDPSGKRRY
jgi:hypothetical protein